MKVVIIGSGNVASVLGRKIIGAGHEIVQVAGRNHEKAAALASSLNAGYTSNILNISSLADIYIIAVSDHAIKTVAAQLQLNHKLVVHTAASVSREVLATSSGNYGVLYPLQTFRKEITRLPVIPVLVDANNEQTKQLLLSFAAKWADTVSFANDEARLKLHLAAVFVNNFTNHLLAVTERLCNDSMLEFNVLKPLIEETILRIEENSPSAVQTGPAIRRDYETISKHQKLLEQQSDLLQLYNALTNSIIRFYSGNKV